MMKMLNMKEEDFEEYEIVEAKLQAFLAEEISSDATCWIMQMVMATMLVTMSQAMDMPKEKFFHAMSNTWDVLEEDEDEDEDEDIKQPLH